MHTYSPLLVVDVDRSGSFPANQLAFALGFEQAEIAESVNDALSTITQRKPAPRYIVVDIGLHGEDMLPVLASLCNACGDSSQVVVVGNINDLGFYRELKKKGVHEYFTHPTNISEIHAALIHHIAPARPSGTNGKTGEVTAFISAASGDGSSTIALNTAYALARQTDQEVVLVDLDYQFGMVARHLDLHAQFGIRELFEFPDRGVDTTLVSNMLLPYGDSSLSIIASPDSLRMLPTIPPNAVGELLNVLKSQFPHVVLDVPHIWAPWTAEVLAQADRVVVVSQLWLRSLTHLSRLLGAWSEAGISHDKVIVGVNRSGARFREALTPQDFERVCFKPIDFYFANDTKTIVSAENQGKTFVELGNSLLERQVRDLAEALNKNNVHTETVSEKVAEKKGLAKLFAKG